MEWTIGNPLRPPQPRTVGARVSAAVFGLVFLAAGCGFLYIILLRPLGQIIAARQWIAMPAQVMSSTVKADSRATYSVAITYTYTVNNQRYESKRYDFVGGASSGRGGKAAIVRHHPSGSELICFVDPHDPAAAVIDRGLQASLWFALLPGVFAAIGIICLLSAFRKTPPVAPTTTTVPWQSRPDWAAGRIRSTDRRNCILTGVFAVIWNAFSWTALLVAWPQMAHQNSPAKWLMLLFPAVGVGLFGAAVYSGLKWLKFGSAFFEMTSVPGVVGGALEGTIKWGRFLRFPTGVTVRLCCLRQITTGAGEHRSTRTQILWESEHPRPDDGGAAAIPVLVAIPADAPETNNANPADQILWQLSASAKLSGVDFAETFIVPVFKLAQTPAQVATAQRARAAELTAVAHYERPATSRIRISNVSSGTEFYFPAARNPGAAAGLTLFTLVWTGMVFAIVYFKAPLLFMLVFGAVGFCLLVAVMNLWLGTARVVASRTGLTITKRLAGIPRYRTVARSAIATIAAKPGMTAGKTVYHDIKIHLTSGSEITAAGSIRDFAEARWLAGEMARCAAVNDQSS